MTDKILIDRKKLENAIAALEAKVRELEAENSLLSEKASRYQAIYDVACQGRDASRQQVERLVEALKKIRGVLWATRDLEIIDEAISAIEQYTKGRKS